VMGMIPPFLGIDASVIGDIVEKVKLEVLNVLP